MNQKKKLRQSLKKTEEKFKKLNLRRFKRERKSQQ